MDIQKRTKNDYVNELTGKIVSSITEGYVDNNKIRPYSLGSNGQDDMYTTIQNLGYKQNGGVNFNKLNRQLKRVNGKSAKAELLERLIEEYTYEQQIYEQEYLKQKISELNLSHTPNPNFLTNNEGKFYRVYNSCLVEEPQVTNVNDDGTYVVKSSIGNNDDILVTTYSAEDKPVTMKIMNKEERVYGTEIFVAKKLKLKKEYVKKYKLHGYSGNSSGISARIRNLVTKPAPSGCYLHDSYNFYKWSFKNKQFEIVSRQGSQVGSPMLADYDIKIDSVVRTDYDGVGMFI